MCSVFKVINHGCVGLQAFCLHTDQIPRNWSREAETDVAEMRKVLDLEREPFMSLRGLANRVRVFKIDVWFLHWAFCNQYFLEQLLPGSTWLGNWKEKSWVCQSTEGRKSMVFLDSV